MNGYTRLSELRISPEALEQMISAQSPAAHGLTVLPFLAGERSPGWKGHARAAIVGLSLHTRPIEILRASLESVAYRFAKIAQLLKKAVPDSIEIIASGGSPVEIAGLDPDDGRCFRTARDCFSGGRSFQPRGCAPCA